MTKLGELLGTMADKLAQDSLNIGDVHFLNLDSNNGITPKAGDISDHWKKCVDIVVQ